MSVVKGADIAAANLAGMSADRGAAGFFLTGICDSCDKLFFGQFGAFGDPMYLPILRVEHLEGGSHRPWLEMGPALTGSQYDRMLLAGWKPDHTGET